MIKGIQKLATREAKKAAARKACGDRPLGHSYFLTNKTGKFPDGLQYIVYGCKNCTARKVIEKEGQI